MFFGDLIFYTFLGVFGFIAMATISTITFYSYRVKIINSYNFIRRRNYLTKIENELDLDIREEYYDALNRLYNDRKVVLYCYAATGAIWSLDDGDFSFKDEEGYEYKSNMKNFAYAFYANHNHHKENLQLNESEKIQKGLLRKKKQEKEAKLKEYLLKYDAMNDIMCELSKEFDKE